MKRILRNMTFALCLPLAAVLTACGVASGEPVPRQPLGQLSLAVTDASVEQAEQVVVAFNGVAVQNIAGDWHEFRFERQRPVDLLNLAGGGSELLLDGVALPAGEYQAIRLLIGADPAGSQSYVVLNAGGEQQAMHMPAEAQGGLLIQRRFTIAPGGFSAFTVDFDLRKSVFRPISPAHAYTLRPALRLVDNLRVGRIVGNVSGDLMNADHCAGGLNPERGTAVYLYEGWGATPDDLGGSGQQPVVSAPVVANPNSATGYSYTLAYVSAGDYTVAFTCQALEDLFDADDSTVDDDLIAFVQPTDVSLTAGTVAGVNFD